jgi:hypothetical protein
MCRDHFIEHRTARIALGAPDVQHRGDGWDRGRLSTSDYISGEQLRECFYRPELIQAKLPGEPRTSPQNTVRLHTDQ